MKVGGFSFKSLPLRKPPARGRGQTWRNTLRPDIGNLIAQPGSVAEARDRPFVALFRICRVPDPYFAVALRVSGCLLHSRRSSLRLSFLSEVDFLEHCPRSSAVCVGAFVVRALFSVVVCLVVERLAVYGVAVAEERSYPIRHRRHCTCHSRKHRHSGRTCIGFCRLHLRSGTALSVVVNHSTRVSFSVFSSRNFRTYRSF